MDLQMAQRIEKMWRPNAGLPWKVKSKGVSGSLGHLDWFEIQDSQGWEILTTDSAPKGTEDYEELFRMVAFIVTTVNRSDVFTLDGELIKVDWMGSKGDQGDKDKRLHAPPR